MMPISRGKPLSEKTNSEIIAGMIAAFVIGSLIGVAAIASVLRSPGGHERVFWAVWSLFMVLFVTWLVFAWWYQSIGELLKRRKNRKTRG